MVKPLKQLFPEFSVIESRVMEIIGQRFAIDLSRLDPAIKRADMVALATEKRDLMPYSTEAWSYLEGIDALPDIIEPMAPQAAKEAFLQAFRSLSAA
jgi:hypothetical protein